MQTSSVTLNLDFVRSYFPALSGAWTYMDNAGGSQTLKTVADRIAQYLLNSNVQLGASYEISQLSEARVAEGSAAMANYINARHPSEVVMGGSTTLVLRILSICLGNTLKPGDEIIVSNSDHEANVSCWMDLRTKGIKVHIWKLRPENLRFELDDLDKLMSERTRLVAVTHTSNVLGTLNPVKDIARFVHDRGALICVDGVAHAPHRLIDVQDLDVDFYAFSFYKVYGPHYALLYGKREHLVRMPGINHYFIDGEMTPYKFQPGNVNFEFAYGMLGLTDYLLDLYKSHFEAESLSMRAKMQAVFELFSRHEEILAEKLLSFLKNKQEIRILGEEAYDANIRVPTISFVQGNRNSEEIVRAIDPYKIGIRFGDFYAKKLIQALELESQNGVVRISMVHYNTVEEVDRLISALDKVLD